MPDWVWVTWGYATAYLGIGTYLVVLARRLARIRRGRGERP